MILALPIQANYRAAAAETRAEHAHGHPRAALDWSRTRTRNRIPALLPFELLRAFADAIFETDARVGRLVAELPRHVLEAEFHGIHLERVGHVIHQRLDPEHALRICRRAIIRSDSGVRIYGGDAGLQMCHLINLRARQI